MVDREFVRVRFRFTRDEDGWPPAESEGLWAEPLGEGRYRIDNVPWFVRDVAEGDVFAAAPDADGTLWAKEKVHWSGNCTIRLVPLRDGPLVGSQQAVLDIFVPLGASGEGFGKQFNIVSLTVSPRADLAEIKRARRRGEVDGSWEYEEGCVSDAWVSA